MKLINIFIFLCLILYSNVIISQNTEVFGDTIKIDIKGYHEGQIKWQFSNDKYNWVDIPNSNMSNISYKIIETGYLRALINTCQGKLLVSDTTFIVAAPPKVDESFFNSSIYAGIKTPVFTRKDVQFCNIKVPNGYEQSQTHPSIEYIENGWNGYDHWLATTPYPNTKYEFENPCIYFSNTNVNGTPPSEFIPIKLNPIQNAPKGGFNSDPDLFLDNDTLYCIFRQSTNITDYVIKKSSDGENWSPIKSLFKSTDIQNTSAASPSIIKENGKYRLFCSKSSSWITPNGTFNKFFILESDKIDGNYRYIEDSKFNFKGSIELWHFELFDYKNTLYMVFCGINNDNKYGTMNTYLAVSYDRKNFNVFPKPLFSDFTTYRPSFYINSMNKFVLYLSSVNLVSSPYSIDGREIGVITKDLTELLKLLIKE